MLLMKEGRGWVFGFGGTLCYLLLGDGQATSFIC
jgi:hypothetical protein